MTQRSEVPWLHWTISRIVIAALLLTISPAIAAGLLFFHTLALGTYFGTAPDSRDYASAAALATLATMAAVIGPVVLMIKRRNRLWRNLTLVLGVAGGTLVLADLIGMIRAQMPV